MFVGMAGCKDTCNCAVHETDVFLQATSEQADILWVVALSHRAARDVFLGAAVPPRGATIVVDYACAEDCGTG